MKTNYLILSLLSIITLLKPLEALSQVTSPAPYCDASFDDMQGFPVDDHINSVSFGTLNNTSNAQYAAPHYVHYNNLPNANFIAGNTYNLNINFTVAGGCGYGVWIDYNYNFIFEANEKVAGTSGSNYLSMGIANISQAITIPTSVANGSTRMRVRIVEDDNHHMISTDELPCNLSTSALDVMDWGETEDYTINLISANSIQALATSSIHITPNPATDKISIDPQFIGSYYSIKTIAGHEVLNGSILESTLSIESLETGTYFVVIDDKKGKISRSLIIKQ